MKINHRENLNLLIWSFKLKIIIKLLRRYVGDNNLAIYKNNKFIPYFGIARNRARLV